MARRALTVTAPAVLVAAVLAASCGSSAGSKSGAARPTARTVHLVVPPPGRAGIDGDFTPIFHGKKPFLSGDSYIKWNRFPRGGFEMVYCAIARQHPRRTFWCRRTFVLPKGQIVTAGDFDDSSEGDAGSLPVVGGTGAYAGAHGTATTTEGRQGGSSTIHLR
jgi:hypothetical protein